MIFSEITRYWKPLLNDLWIKNIIIIFRTSRIPYLPGIPYNELSRWKDEEIYLTIRYQRESEESVVRIPNGLDFDLNSSWQSLPLNLILRDFNYIYNHLLLVPISYFSKENLIIRSFITRTFTDRKLTENIYLYIQFKFCVFIQLLNEIGYGFE